MKRVQDTIIKRPPPTMVGYGKQLFYKIKRICWTDPPEYE